MNDSGKLSPNGQRAIHLFEEQLAALGVVRNLLGTEFAKWKESTRALFMEYLPTSPRFIRFSKIQFGVARTRNFSVRWRPSPQTMQQYYQLGCDAAEQCIRGAIEDIERFDVELPTQPSTHQPSKTIVSSFLLKASLSC